MTNNYTFEDSKEVKNQFFKFGKIGDSIIGTLIGRRMVPSAFKDGELVSNYELKVKSGSFHNLDDKKQPVVEVTTLKAGDFWVVSGKAAIDDKMRNIADGTVVGFKFIAETPNKKKGFAASKNIKVYNFGPDPDAEISAEEVVGE